jgi:hypothetical protein
MGIAKGNGWGALMVMQPPGDVPMAVSPVPLLRRYQIVCGPDDLFDVLKDREYHWMDRTLDQIRTWIRENTPEWLYDDGKPTQEQKETFVEWVRLTCEMYGMPWPTVDEEYDA